MNVLVTGATGLLGANVVRELLRRNHHVGVMVRKSSDLRGIKDLPAELVYGDIVDSPSLEKAIEGRDAVIHAAANTSQWPAGFRHYETVNVAGTRNVIAACKKIGTKRIVYVSTANVFGNGTLEHPGTELSEFSAFRTNSGYAISKYLAQQFILTEVERSGVPVVIVNPTFMLGKYDYKPSSGRILLPGLHRKVLFCPAGGKNFIHVEDAAAGVCNALVKGSTGECYILANENMTYRDFFSRLNELNGRPHCPSVIAKGLIISAGRFGSFFEKISRKDIPLTLPNARMLILDNYYSGKKAVEELDLPQRPVEKAIRDATTWLQELEAGTA